MSQMTIHQALALAVSHHQSGRFAEAEAIYRQVLAVAPQSQDALNLLGMIAYARGQLIEAGDLISQAITVAPGVAGFHFNLGNVLRDSGDLPAAIASYRRMLQLEPRFPDGHRTLGDALWRAGFYVEAVNAFEAAIAINSGDVASLGSLGGLLADLDQPEKAVAFCDRAIALAPQIAELFCNRGNAHYKRSDLERATADYRRAVELKPEFFIARSHLANALWKQRQLEESLRQFQQVLATESRHVPAHVGISRVLRELNRPEEAVAFNERSCDLIPHSAPILDELGSSYWSAGRLQEAIDSYDTAIAHDPGFPEPHVNLAITLLLSGQLPRGWMEYQWRWRCPGLFSAAAPPPLPPWEGEPLAGKSILLCGEQGFGDTFQFVRYGKVLSDLGATVLLSCQPALVELMRQCPFLQQVTCNTEPFPPADFYAPLLEMPRILNTDLTTIPVREPYLFAPVDRVEHWHMRFVSPRGKLRCGLVWSGNPQHVRDRERSIPLRQLSPLLAVPGVLFYSLQKGPAALQANDISANGLNVDFAQSLGDFADTAGMIAQLDLVIAVDTAVAHLAAAMGKPVWLLVTHIPDWRWLLNRSDSPWYPSLQIFRQTHRQDWTAVIAQAATALAELARNRDAV